MDTSSSSLYTVNFQRKEYLELVNDIVRMVTIQLTIQFLFYINSPSTSEFFAVDFVFMLIYLVLGVCVYWLIIKKLVLFK